MWPEAVAGAKGYSTSELRILLQARDIESVIPYWKDESGDQDYDREAYREWAINRLKHHRRIATHYEKLVSRIMAMVTFAMILEWI